jgi:riboflavin biosynthesis pyrimidine reductase
VSTEPVTFRRLLPEPAEVGVEDLLGALDFGARAPEQRPYTFVNFVASADGRATYAGRSGALGDDGDHAMFHGLRESADAVMAGTVTLRTERYEPLLCIITRSGDVPTEIPLFAEPEARIVIFSASAVQLGSPAAQVEMVRLDPAELTLTTALRRLRADFGVRTLLCEGGPTLFGALLRERIVDELFLTLAPKLGGGGNGPAVTSGPELPGLQLLRIEWLLERHDSLYLRYRLAPSEAGS